MTGQVPSKMVALGTVFSFVSAPGARLVAELGARGMPKAGQVLTVGRAGRGENASRSW